MEEKRIIEEFLAQPKLAVAGVSSHPYKFGNIAMKELRKKGYTVFPVNPRGQEVAGERCFDSLAALPEPVGGVFVAVPRAQCEKVVRDAAACGIRRVWLQQGCDTPEALRFCRSNGIDVVAGRCILMFADPHGLHGFHRWLWGAMGKLPA
jgi:predicted CoA-binding protein